MEELGFNFLERLLCDFILCRLLGLAGQSTQPAVRYVLGAFLYW